MGNHTPATTKQVEALKASSKSLALEWAKVALSNPGFVITFGYHPSLNKVVYEKGMKVGPFVVGIDQSDGIKEHHKIGDVYLKDYATGRPICLTKYTVEDTVTDLVFEDCFRTGSLIMVASKDEHEDLAIYGAFWAKHNNRVIRDIERGKYDRKE